MSNPNNFPIPGLNSLPAPEEEIVMDYSRQVSARVLELPAVILDDPTFSVLCSRMGSEDIGELVEGEDFSIAQSSDASGRYFDATVTIAEDVLPGVIFVKFIATYGDTITPFTFKVTIPKYFLRK